MKKLFNFIYWKLSFILLKLTIPLFLIFYLGIYTLLGYEIRTRWGYLELTFYESWFWILFGTVMIIYSFDIFKLLRIKELEKFFSSVDENKEKKEMDTSLQKDPIEQIFESENSQKRK